MILNKSAKYSSNLRNNKKNKKKICHARRRLFSATCAVTVVPHMHFCVIIASLIIMDFFCYFITLLIVLLIWTTLLYTIISFSVSSALYECFQSKFLPIVITLQVLHIIFNRCNINANSIPIFAQALNDTTWDQFH